MNNTAYLERLIAIWVIEHELSTEDSRRFIEDFVNLLIESLRSEGYVRIKGLGTFRLMQQENTGETIESIEEITFTPDDELRMLINKPFAHFETVILHPHARFADIETHHPAVSEVAVPNPECFSKETREENAEAMRVEERVEERSDSLYVSSSFNMGTEEESEPKPGKRVARGKMWISVFLATLMLSLILWGGCVIYQSYCTTTTVDQFNADVSEPENELNVGCEQMGISVDSVEIAPVDSLSSDTTKEISGDLVYEQEVSTPASSPDLTGQYDDSMNYEIVGTQVRHIVAEGETLMRISLKYYGTKAMWSYVYEHNRSVISEPNNLPYGTSLRIPILKKRA